MVFGGPTAGGEDEVFGARRACWLPSDEPEKLCARCEKPHTQQFQRQCTKITVNKLISIKPKNSPFKLWTGQAPTVVVEPISVGISRVLHMRMEVNSDVNIMDIKW